MIRLCILCLICYAFWGQEPTEVTLVFCASSQEAHGVGVPHSWGGKLPSLSSGGVARFLHCQVTIFPFIIINYLVGKYLETIQIFLFLKLLTSNLNIC